MGKFPPAGRLLWKPAAELTEADLFECDESIARGDDCLSCGAKWVYPDTPVSTSGELIHKLGCPYNLKLDQMEEEEHANDWEYEADGPLHRS